MKPETPVIAIVVASLIFIGLFGFFTTVATTNNIPFNTTVYTSQNGNVNIQSAFNRINESNSKVNKIVDDYNNATLSDPSSLFSFSKIAKNAGSVILDSIATFKDILYISGELLGIPPEIISGAVIIILISILLTLLYILIGR